MPIAAVPEYLGQDFSSASPGMRFGMYLPLWGINRRTQDRLWKTHDVVYEVRGANQQEREVKYENKVFALKAATRLGVDDKKLMEALQQRQAAVFASAASESSKICLPAIATAPFTTGLGNEHPLENGFAFLNPYGLPYLPGSGVKGVLRHAARELASGDWGDSPWREYNRSLSGVEANAADFDSGSRERSRMAQSATYLDALFGREDNNEALRGTLSFWDVIPQIKGDSLMVEIMTPHQGHYYQQNPTAGSTSPHDSGQPIPISYLTVPPDSGFTFHVVCDLSRLERIAPDLARDGNWKTLITAAFEHAFAWCGFGAKTAVGYGAMARDVEAEARDALAKAKAESQARLDSLPPNLQNVEKFRNDMAQRFASLNGSLDRQNTEYHQKAQKLAKDAREGGDWTPEEKRAAADAITEWLPKVVERIDKDAFKKLKLAALQGEN